MENQLKQQKSFNLLYYNFVETYNMENNGLDSLYQSITFIYSSFIDELS